MALIQGQDKRLRAKSGSSPHHVVWESFPVHRCLQIISLPHLEVETIVEGVWESRGSGSQSLA